MKCEIPLLVLLSIAVLKGCNGQISMDPNVTITRTVPPSDGFRVRGTIAQDVTLNCYVDYLVANSMVRWQRTTFDASGSEVQTIPISIDMDSQDVNKWSIEKPTPFSWRLRIKALQLQDEGNYTCFVQLNIQTRVEANRTVLVTASPLMIEQQTSSDTTAKEGDQLELMCNATGRPSPTIMWRREGNAILPGGGVIRLDNVLKIDNLDYTHQGRYFCEAVNEVGATYRDILLYVQYSPKVQAENADGYGQAVGFMRTLACLIDAYPPPSLESDANQLLWIRGNTGIQPTGDRWYTRVIEGAHNKLTYELTIRSVKEDDYGIYKCRVKNNIGQADAEVTLYQTEDPQPDKGYLASSETVVSSLILISASLMLHLVH